MLLSSGCSIFNEQHGGVETVTEIVRIRGTSLTGVADALASKGRTQKSLIFLSIGSWQTIYLSIAPLDFLLRLTAGTVPTQVAHRRKAQKFLSRLHRI